MEFMVIIMHIMTQQMKGMLKFLDAVGVTLEIAACAGKAVSISVETVLANLMCSSFCTEINLKARGKFSVSCD